MVKITKNDSACLAPIFIGPGVYKQRKVVQSENNYGKVSVFGTWGTSRVPSLRGRIKGQ